MMHDDLLNFLETNVPKEKKSKPLLGVADSRMTGVICEKLPYIRCTHTGGIMAKSKTSFISLKTLFLFGSLFLSIVLVFYYFICYLLTWLQVLWLQLREEFGATLRSSFTIFRIRRSERHSSASVTATRVVRLVVFIIFSAVVGSATRDDSKYNCKKRLVKFWKINYFTS